MRDGILITPAVSFDGIMQFLTIVILFIFVLAITYFATRWIANYQKGRTFGDKIETNIEIIETYRLTSTKYLQIIRMGGKYLAIGVGRDEIAFLAELDGDAIHLPEKVSGPMPDFSSILEKIKNLKK